MLITLLLIQAIIVFVIDLSGFITEMEKILSKKRGKKVLIRKPFSCSLCLSFYAGLLALIITGNITIPLIAYVCLLAFLTPITGEILITLKDLLGTIIYFLQKLTV